MFQGNDKMEERKSSLDLLTEEYVEYKQNSDQFQKELEVRFGTRGKDITRYEFENVIKKLQSCGYINTNPEGIHMLRIMLKYNKDEHSVTSIRSEIQNIENIQQFCKTNRLPNSNAVSFQKKLNVKKEGIKLLPYINNDYLFKVSFQIEDNIHSQSQLIQTKLLERWEQTPKSYRHMNRLVFKSSDTSNPLVFHLTIIKSSEKNSNGEYVYEKNIRSVNLFEKPETYEIEIEIDNTIVQKEMITGNELAKQMRKGIKQVLCGIQNTNYPVPFKQLNSVKKEYLRLVGIDKDVVNVVSKDFIGPGSITLQMHNVQDNLNETTQENIRKNYSVTEKADGERRLLFICQRGNVYLIDTNMNILFTGLQTKKKNIFSSLLDGELILHDKFGKFINLFAAFDVYFINNEDRRDLHFRYESELKQKMTIVKKKGKEKEQQGRLTLLEKFVRIFNDDISERNIRVNFEVKSKEFYMFGNIFEHCNTIITKANDGLFIYETDGLIFTPVNCNIPIVSRKITWDKSFKWKPPEYNTIDFLVSIVRESGSDKIENFPSNSGEIISYKKLLLKCGFDEERDGYMNPLRTTLDEDWKTGKQMKRGNTYKPYLFYPTSPYDQLAHQALLPMRNYRGIYDIYTEENELIEHNTIVEFRYNLNKERGRCWEPLRVRYDKTLELRNKMRNYGNSYQVANSNWYSIHNPVTEHMITTGLNIPSIIQEDGVYYKRVNNRTHSINMRDFHNLYVKKTLINNVSSPGFILFDMAVGKGGDLPKWVDSRLGFVFGVDYSQDNIENRINGAYARYLNTAKRRKNIPDCLFVHGDSSLLYKEVGPKSGILNDQYKLIYDAIMGKGPKEESKLGKAVFKKYGIGKDGFQVTSCQFALHYFFKDITSLENFIQNVIDVTEVGGYFIGTSYDGKRMFKFLQDKKRDESVVFNNENGEKMWEVQKLYSEDLEFEDNVESLGMTINVYQDAIGTSFKEYLVNYDYFTLLMEQYGFTLLNQDELKEVGFTKSIGSFKDLYSKLNNDVKSGIVSETNIGNALHMNENEKNVSFMNNYFIFKKIRHEISSVALMGNKINEDNEINVELNESNSNEKVKFEKNDKVYYTNDSKEKRIWKIKEILDDNNIAISTKDLEDIDKIKKVDIITKTSDKFIIAISNNVIIKIEND